MIDMGGAPPSYRQETGVTTEGIQADLVTGTTATSQSKVFGVGDALTGQVEMGGQTTREVFQDAYGTAVVENFAVGNAAGQIQEGTRSYAMDMDRQTGALTTEESQRIVTADLNAEGGPAVLMDAQMQRSGFQDDMGAAEVTQRAVLDGRTGMLDRTEDSQAATYDPSTG